MSDFTTHYITAKRAIDRLKLGKQEARGMLFGVQGPDFLFYASVLKTTDDVRFGHEFHGYVPKFFFENCVEMLKNRNVENYELKRGYVMGMMLHYLGDKTIHPYIGWREEFRNESGDKYIHMQNESEIDLLMYKREYGKDVLTLNVGKEMKYDKSLEEVIFDTWNCQEVHSLSRKVIKKGFRTLVLSGKVFAKNQLKWLLALAEGKNSKGVFTCHYKDDVNEPVLNMEKEEWSFAGVTSNMSVPEIVDRTMELFYEEVEKIDGAIEKGGEYEFNHEENFNGVDIDICS